MSIARKLMSGLKTRGGALALLAVAQLGALSYMVADRVRLLKTGREVLLPIIPVDPRDLFKGDYVRLAYDVSTVQSKMLEGAKAAPHSTLYVTIAPAADGKWQVVSASASMPDSVPADQIVLKGKLDGWARRGLQAGRMGDQRLNVHYGLERYYVPEGRGKPLEDLARNKKLAAIVAVDAKGNAAIKGIAADGKKVYDEPTF